MLAKAGPYGRAAIVWIAVLLLMVSSSAVWAQEPNRAAVVVRLADDQVEARCVGFTEPSLSGYDLLSKSGLALESRVEGSGGLVCQIEGTGCPAADCWCQCKGGQDCVYWSYWRQVEGEWRYAQLGATNTVVRNGEVEGWSWGPGTVSKALEPPAFTFEEICGVKATAQLDIPASDPAPQADYLQYAAFGLIAASLGLLLVRLRRSAS